MPNNLPFVVDGLALGSRVNLGSTAYRSYQCSPSEQYEGLTWCNWRREERPQTGKITLTNSILHDTDGTALYINQSVEPAILDGGAVDAEIERLSRRFQERARVTQVTAKNGLPAAVIAQWGQVRLEPLDQENIRSMAAGRKPRNGILVDFLADFEKSAREGLPVFRIGGGPGYIWSARYDRSKKGALRYFALDASRLNVRLVHNRPGDTSSDGPARPPVRTDVTPVAPDPSDCFKVPSSQPEQVISACTVGRDARKTKGSYERALNRLGLAYSRINKKEEALRQFNSLIASDNSSAGYYDNRREVRRALGHWENALSDANAAIRLAPAMAFVYQGRGDVYFDMGKFDLAIADYTKAYAQKDHFAVNIFSRGRAYAMLRQFENAITDFSAALEADPGMTAALRERALAYAERGMLENAERDLLLCLERDPSDPAARQKLAEVRVELPPQQERPEIKQASQFLDDARKFIALQSHVDAIAEIGRLAAQLQLAIDAANSGKASEVRRQFADLLGKIAGFDEFIKNQGLERDREQARKLAEANAEADKGLYFIDRYTQEHLGSKESADLLRLRNRIDGARQGRVLSDVAAANDALRASIEKSGLGDAYKAYVQELASGKPVAKGEPKSLEEQLGIGPAAQFLVQGSLDDILVLYNDAPSAPSVTKSIRGEYVFRTGTATLCSAQPAPDISMVRFVERIVRQTGANKVVTDDNPCVLATATARADLMFAPRRWLLSQGRPYLLQFIGLVDAGSFREFRTVPGSELQQDNQSREARSRDYERQVDRGERAGYGVVIIADAPPPACLVNPEHSAEKNGLKRLLAGDRSTIAPSARSEWQFIEERSIDDAFFDLRRRQCGYVVAKAADLKTLMLALRRERRDYTFAPVWFDEQQVAAAAFEARDEQEESIRKEEERKRADADKEQLRKQRERDRQQEKTERERVLRLQNGTRGRALRDSIDAVVKKLANEADPDDSFPEFSRWLQGRFADRWKTFDVSSDVLDFGNVEWRGRNMDAVLVQSVVQQKNRGLGQYSRSCFVFGLIDDPEFSMQREVFSRPCEASADVAKWKVGNKFRSLWNAD